METTSIEVVRNALASLAAWMAVGLVDDVSCVGVESTIKDGVLVVTVRVADNDIGKLVGKKGHTARALRTIMAGVAAKHGIRCDLVIEDGKQRDGKQETRATEDAIRQEDGR